MVSDRQQPDTDGRTAVVATSNLSMSLEALFYVFLGLCTVTVAVALLPTLQGYWPIMCFAVLHLLIVGACLRRAWRGNWAREVITIGPESMVIERAGLEATRSSEMPTAWTRVIVEAGDPDRVRVYLAHHGRRLEVGDFLPPAERRELAVKLSRGLAPFSAWSASNRSQVSTG